MPRSHCQLNRRAPPTLRLALEPLAPLEQRFGGSDDFLHSTGVPTYVKLSKVHTV
jgi:hypothetical protein